ncbi:hypothetical protein K438DRAFT_1960885 [Mycena galopus ATCC 62051]|nr:hypothetical protein K438DRAFT_1960885 [Mycena galopus ATCC 62051]
MDSESSTGECTAHDKHSNQECDCVEFTESSEIPGYCENCWHRRHHHLFSKPAATKKSNAVKSLIAGIMSRDAPADTGKSKASSSKSRGSMFPSLAAVVGASSSKSKSSALSAAHRESNQGMRPESAGASGSKNKKGKGKEKRNTFKVVSVQVIPCGTKVINGVRHIPEEFNQIPDRVQTQTAKIDNLAVVDSQGIVIDRDASHEEVVEHFTQLLPHPFEHFARVEEEADDGERAWDLATPVKNKLVIVPLDSDGPDGSTIDFNKGTATTGFRNSRVFIVSRDPIPVELLREWAGPSSSSYNLNDDDSGVLSDADSNNEHIPSINKRRLSSRTSDDDDAESEEKPRKKKKQVSSKKWTRGIEILNDATAQEISGSPFIDLTDDARMSHAPDFLRNMPKSPPAREDPPSPGRPEPHHDPTLGNPYDKSVTFEF